MSNRELARERVASTSAASVAAGTVSGSTGASGCSAISGRGATGVEPVDRSASCASTGASALGRVMAGTFASAPRSDAKPGSARNSMGATVKATATTLAAFRIRLIVSVKRAADEPKPHDRRGAIALLRLRSSSDCVSASDREFPNWRGTPEATCAFSMCRATYCAPHQCQANKPHSATSCGAFAMSNSITHRSGSALLRRST